MIVTDGAERWHDDACRIGRVYKTGERSVPVALRPHGGRLQVTWDRGARAELRRCQ